jgi:metal-responsive CopG/Arc/MetJ family transcriptional regulator
MRTTKHISITFPAAMARDAARLARRENRTMSELLREAFRHYRTREDRRASDEFASIYRMIADVKNNPLSPTELEVENRRLMKVGAALGKKAGIREREVVRVIHESRARRRSAS